MAERRFLLVDADVLPEVFVKVLQAKELLASGAVSNISAAAKQAGISRSAFYKYKDTVFDAETPSPARRMARRRWRSRSAPARCRCRSMRC